jgi:DNA-3-methyladenine glycosylase II
MTTFELVPQGPFDLASAQDFAGGFTPGIGGGGVQGTSIVMAFPVEAPGWTTSAAVEVHQRDDGVVVARTDARPELLDAVRRQAARSLSLDHDGTGWPAVGARDPVVGALQQRYRMSRPVCFYSAYEAATSFVMGQRIAMRQLARVKERLRETAGDRPTVDGHGYAAFPRPEVLLEHQAIQGLNDDKVRRVHELARAALDGRLDTEALRALPTDEALARLRELPGVGAFSAEAVLLRGCGVVNAIPTTESASREAIGSLYGIDTGDREAVDAITDGWRPYRMWATVLVRMGWSRQAGKVSYRPKGPG